MTRLTSMDIDTIVTHLPDYDRCLRSITGRNLLEIGVAASGIEDVDRVRQVAPSIKMAVVPIRSGLGVISGFSKTVAGILTHMGFDTWITRHPDVAGFADAVDMNADVILASDDDRFVAFCPRQGKTVDNGDATGRGFVTGLEFMTGGLAAKTILVLGCGPVGRSAVGSLLTRKAGVCVFDIVAANALAIVNWAKAEYGADIQIATDAEQALSTHDLIIDATNAAEIIQAHHVTAHTHVAAPGMPCGVTAEARVKLEGRMLHDPLQIGVAAMAGEAVRILLEGNPSVI